MTGRVDATVTVTGTQAHAQAWVQTWAHAQAHVTGNGGKIINPATMKDSYYGLPPVPPRSTLGVEFYVGGKFTGVKLQRGHRCNALGWWQRVGAGSQQVCLCGVVSFDAECDARPDARYPGR